MSRSRTSVFFSFSGTQKKIVLKIFAALRAAFFQLNTINNRISLYNLLPQAKKIRNYTRSHEFPPIFDQMSMDFSEISCNFFGDAEFFLRSDFRQRKKNEIILR